MVAGVKGRFPHPETHPATMRALREVRKLASLAKARRSGNRVSSVALNYVERSRKALNSMINTAQKPSDAGAVIAMKNGLDRWLEEAADDGLIMRWLPRPVCGGDKLVHGSGGDCPAAAE